MIYIYTAALFLACFLLLGCLCAVRAELRYQKSQRDPRQPLDYPDSPTPAVRVTLPEYMGGESGWFYTDPKET